MISPVELSLVAYQSKTLTFISKKRRPKINPKSTLLRAKEKKDTLTETRIGRISNTSRSKIIKDSPIT